MTKLQLTRPRWPRFVIALNVIVQIVALGWLVLMANIWFFSTDLRSDFTSDQRLSLSTETKNTLQALGEAQRPVKAIIIELLPPNADGLLRKRVLQRAARLCGEFEKVSPNFVLSRYVRVGRQPDLWLELKERYRITEPNCVYLISEIPDSPPVRVPLDSMATFRKFNEEDLLSRAAILEERVEEVLGGALQKVLNPKSTRIALIEESADDQDPYALLKRDLKDRGIEVVEIDPRYQETIESDFEAVIVPSQFGKPLSASSAGKIRDYLQRGGRALVTLTTGKEPPLEKLLALYSIAPHPGLVANVGPEPGFGQRPTHYLFIRRFNQKSTVSRNFIYQGLQAMELNRSRALALGESAIPLIVTEDNAWLELDTVINRDPSEVSGAFSIAATSELGDSRVIVLGTDSLLKRAFFRGVGKQFVLSCLYWLLDREESVAGSGREDVIRRIQLTPENRWQLFLGAGVVFPLIPVSLGLLVLLVRRFR